MLSKEWTFRDRSDWAPGGAWEREPDKAQWQDAATGLPCLAVRGPGGHWCGYVGVAEGHPYFGVSYSECTLSPKCEEYHCDHSPDCSLRAHGGITFTNFCAEEKEHGICHIAAPGEPERVSWFGFDCAHAGDLAPGWDRGNFYRAFLGDVANGDQYRTLDYVKAQCAGLAQQLMAQAEGR